MMVPSCVAFQSLPADTAQSAVISVCQWIFCPLLQIKTIRSHDETCGCTNEICCDKIIG